jgi:hypothetical protein
MITHTPKQFLPAEDEAIEAKAFIDLHKVSPGALKADERFECLAISGGCAISLPNAPAIGLNRVLGLSSDEDLETAYQWMKAKRGNRFLQVNVDSASAETNAWIKAKGLEEHGVGWAKLVYDSPTTSFTVTNAFKTRRVYIEEAKLFGTMMCDGFNFPKTLCGLWSGIVGKEGWSCFFALKDDKPVGTAAMYRSGTHAWLGGGSTVPEFRNRGVQKALIKSRIEQGVIDGASTFVVETLAPVVGEANISFDNLKKIGFRHSYNRKNFML